MCGFIFAYIKKNNSYEDPFLNLDNPNFVSKLKSVLNHRGPDNFSIEKVERDDGNLYFLHYRLSIIDLSSRSNQPIKEKNSNNILVYNGEIYNFKEIADECSFQEKYKFSDSLTLFKILKDNKPNFDKTLVGMYAYCFYNSNNEYVEFGRDIYGMKPIYLMQDKYGNIFSSSEIKGIKFFNNLTINKFYIDRFLSFGDQDDTYFTQYKGIFNLKPGNKIRYDLKKSKFFEFNNGLQRIKNKKEIHKDKKSSKVNKEKILVKELRDLFLDSVELHLNSDVPISFSLSGGLDSSSILCCARLLKPNLKLYSYSYVPNQESISESKYINLVSSHCNSIHKNVFVNKKDVIKLFSKLLRYQDETFSSYSLIGQAAIYRKISQDGFKVVIEGQGGDEVTCGYQGYIEENFRNSIRSFEIFRSIKLLKRIISDSSDLKVFISSLIKSTTYKSNIFRAINNSKINELVINDLKNYSDYSEMFRKGSFAESTINSDFYKSLNDISRRLFLDQTALRIPRLLRYSDRTSMMYSLEARMPFLNPRLSEFFLSIDGKYYLGRDLLSKSLFRKAMKNIVPEEILYRKDKMGFEVPEYSIFKQIGEFYNKKYVSSKSADWTDIRKQITDLCIKNQY